MTTDQLTRQNPVRAVRTTHLDEAHVGDIVGALGTIQRDTARPRSVFRRLLALLAILGPGLIVMVGDNDVGGVSTYVQHRLRQLVSHAASTRSGQD